MMDRAKDALKRAFMCEGMDGRDIAENVAAAIALIAAAFGSVHVMAALMMAFR